eukprot:TRINITY_DN2177_c0_g1_i2.p1 TRINITY_DN2177_c0_g1~~TRINITY_DN2177_c0_g1_i2.p1  ORF type:complete len:326 (-),score=116.17 TRINITY_DN2177_c0_g1_i2:346-1296(-)
MGSFVFEYGFIVAFLYGVVSLSITFFNKAVLSYYGFNYSTTLVLAQMLFALAATDVLRRRGTIVFPPANRATAKKMTPLATFFLLMVLVSLVSLAYVNISIYNTLRRLTTFAVMVGEYMFFKKVTPMDESMSVALMILGAFVSGYGDLSFSFISYAITLVSCVITAAYTVCIKLMKDTTPTSEFEMMFYNNVLSLPIVLVMVIVFELQAILSYPYLFNIGFLICFFTSMVQAFMLNYLMFLCSTVNSPLTTSVTGQLKAIISTVAGLFMFGDIVVNKVLVIGLSISAGGGVYYAYIKYNQQQQAASRCAFVDVQIT